MKNKMKPRSAMTGEAYNLPRALPRGLQEALDLFADDHPVTEVLGKGFCAVYKAVKRHEAEAFQQVISPWEREHLMTNV